ncbi:MAG: hypothetical protein V5A25_06995, partial [Halovenus sp.]
SLRAGELHVALLTPSSPVSIDCQQLCPPVRTYFVDFPTVTTGVDPLEQDQHFGDGVVLVADVGMNQEFTTRML